MKHLILHEAREKNGVKDILFDYDIYCIRPGAGTALVSMEENDHVHAVTGGHCFSGSCRPVIRRKMSGES